MHGSTSPAKKGLPSHSSGPAAPPGHVVADEAHRAARLVARGIETQVAQQHQDVHGGVPPAVPGRAGPRPVGPLQGEQPRAHALGGDPRALGRDLIRGRTDQVSQHLPADRRVGVEQPLRHCRVGCGGRRCAWIARHLQVLLCPRRAGPEPAPPSPARVRASGHCRSRTTLSRSAGPPRRSRSRRAGRDRGPRRAAWSPAGRERCCPRDPAAARRWRGRPCPVRS